MIKCYGGGFDGVSIKHFTLMASLLHRSGGHNAIHNTAIFINDCKISQDGYPDRKAFAENGSAYLGVADYIIYRDRVIKEKQDTVPLKRLAMFIAQWINVNRKKKLMR
jgi:hypothetical protein